MLRDYTINTRANHHCAGRRPIETSHRPLHGLEQKTIIEASSARCDGKEGLLLLFEEAQFYIVNDPEDCSLAPRFLDRADIAFLQTGNRIPGLSGKTIHNCIRATNDLHDTVFLFIIFDDQCGLAITPEYKTLGLFWALPLGMQNEPTFECLLTCSDDRSLGGLLDSVAVDQRDAVGRTPLHIAAMRDLPVICRDLIALNSPINSLDSLGNTPLHYSAYMNCTRSSRVLLLSGANIQAKDHDGLTPLHIAAEFRSLDVAKLLLEHDTALVHTKSLEGNEALSLAAKADQPEMIDLLLRYGSQPNASNASGICALHEAVRWGFPRNVEKLLSAGADPDQEDHSGCSSLHYLWQSSYEVASLLIAAGAHVDARDNDGNTALHRLCMYRDSPYEILELLASAGADLEARNESGLTPFDLALKQENETSLAFFQKVIGTDCAPRKKGRSAEPSCTEIEARLFPIICQPLCEVWQSSPGPCPASITLRFPNSQLTATTKSDGTAKDLDLLVSRDERRPFAMANTFTLSNGLRPWSSMIGTRTGASVYSMSGPTDQHILWLFNHPAMDRGAIIQCTGPNLRVLTLTRWDPYQH